MISKNYDPIHKVGDRVYVSIPATVIEANRFQIKVDCKFPDHLNEWCPSSGFLTEPLYAQTNAETLECITYLVKNQNKASKFNHDVYSFLEETIENGFCNFAEAKRLLKTFEE